MPLLAPVFEHSTRINYWQGGSSVGSWAARLAAGSLEEQAATVKASGTAGPTSTRAWVWKLLPPLCRRGLALPIAFSPKGWPHYQLIRAWRRALAGVPLPTSTPAPLMAARQVSVYPAEHIRQEEYRCILPDLPPLKTRQPGNSWREYDAAALDCVDSKDFCYNQGRHAERSEASRVPTLIHSLRCARKMLRCALHDGLLAYCPHSLVQPADHDGPVS